jgi:hypothetical protein
VRGRIGWRGRVGGTRRGGGSSPACWHGRARTASGADGGLRGLRCPWGPFPGCPCGDVFAEGGSAYGGYVCAGADEEGAGAEGGEDGCAAVAVGYEPDPAGGDHPEGGGGEVGFELVEAAVLGAYGGGEVGCD